MNKKIRKGFRLITVNNRQWQYRIYKHTILAYALDNQCKLHTTIGEILNLSPDEVDRGHYKGTIRVTPKHIADWINSKV